MKLKIICIGKTTERYLQKGVAMYRERLKHYTKVEWNELPEPKQANKYSEQELMKKEAELVRKELGRNVYLVLLDERGQQFDSRELANFMNERMVSGLKELVVVVGGAYGFDENLKKEADLTLSLSRLTFTHQMVRLILAEQLYRAMTILRNEPYHHGR